MKPKPVVNFNKIFPEASKSDAHTFIAVCTDRGVAIWNGAAMHDAGCGWFISEATWTESEDIYRWP